MVVIRTVRKSFECIYWGAPSLACACQNQKLGTKGQIFECRLEITIILYIVSLSKSIMMNENCREPVINVL